MAKVYLSSTVADLQPEREAVIDWLVTAGHQPVHSYRPNSETVRESCLEDIDGCSLYVLILGHRYGFQPEEGNPEKLSITHLEFRRAGEKNIPRIALLRTCVPDIALSDLLDTGKAALVKAFHTEVRDKVRPAEFSDQAGLILGLSTGVQGELEKLSAKQGSDRPVDDSRVLQIVAALTDDLARKNRRIEELEQQLQLRAAVELTLKAASQPGAGKAETAAADALVAGDTRPAEALLGNQERQEAAQIGAPGANDERQRSQAAALARGQGALALGHDVSAALAAYQRAAEYEPDDTRTHFFIGDLHVVLGDLGAAMQHFERGAALAEALAARDPANTEWQRDLSVSHDRIGDVLVAQGDGPGALAAYRKGLGIAEALAARDPANAQWQTDVAVSCAKLGALAQVQSVNVRRDYLVRGRGILAKLREEGRLAPNQDWIEWFDGKLEGLS